MFCEKWAEKGEETMISYLSTTYSRPWQNWKLFSVPCGILVHNNAIEGVNGAFKTNGTLRERSDLGTFATSIMSWLKVESKSTSPLPTAPLVTPSTWREGQLLVCGTNCRVDFCLKANSVAAFAQVQLPHLRDAWLMPSYSCVQSLSAPTSHAKQRQLLGMAVKFVQYASRPEPVAHFRHLVNV